MRKLICLLGLVGLSVFALYPVRVSSEKLPAVDWRAKVDPKVLAESANGQTEFIIYMAQQADLSGAAALATKEEKGRYVFEQLTAVAQATQPSVKEALNLLGVEYRAFWVTNSIWVKGGADAVQAMARRPEAAPIESPCITPGITIATDPAGDNTTGAGSPSHDIRLLSVAEVYDPAAAANKLFSV